MTGPRPGPRHGSHVPYGPFPAAVSQIIPAASPWPRLRRGCWGLHIPFCPAAHSGRDQGSKPCKIHNLFSMSVEDMENYNIKELSITMKLFQDHHGFQPRPDRCCLRRLLHRPLPAHWRQSQVSRVPGLLVIVILQHSLAG